MTDKNPDPDNHKEPGGAKMPFTQHLKELRRRLIFCFIGIGLGFGVCYYFSQEIFRVLMIPLKEALPEGEKLIYTSLPGAFIVYLKVGFWGGVILASPVIFHQLWGFVAPGLYQNEKRYVVPFVFFSTALFLLGGFFGYFLAFPVGFKFLVSFSDEYVRALPSINEYFSFALMLLFGFGLVFELPLILVFLGKVGLVNARMLSRGRKWAVLIIFIVAGVLTPGPDVLSQALMAGPLLLFYELSIILVRLMVRPKQPAPEMDKEADAATS
ncbi:MAG: twin-arginine translocase subunit TatC [Thermodesulfobacteriota bacterium]